MVKFKNLKIGQEIGYNNPFQEMSWTGRICRITPQKDYIWVKVNGDPQGRKKYYEGGKWREDRYFYLIASLNEQTITAKNGRRIRFKICER